MGSDVFRHLVVLNGRQGGGQRGFLIVEIGLRRGREHVHVDARVIHIAQPARDVEAAGWERPVHRAGHVERGVLGIVGRDGDLGTRLGQQRGGFLAKIWAWVSIVRSLLISPPKDAAKMPLGRGKDATVPQPARGRPISSLFIRL